MIGIVEMFAELDGYERYEVDLLVWASHQRAQKRERDRTYLSDPLARRKKLEHSKQRYRAKLALVGRTVRPPSRCGTVHRYNTGCRCDACRAAMASYMREYKRTYNKQAEPKAKKASRERAYFQRPEVKQRYRDRYRNDIEFRNKTRARAKERYLAKLAAMGKQPRAARKAA